MKQYKELVADVLQNGVVKRDRTGVGTVSVFGRQLRFDLQEGFPLVTLKYTPFKLIVTELLWFISGNTNVKWLQEQNCHIWDEWADSEGNLGPIYGHQWRSWTTSIDQEGYPVGRIDQLQDVISRLRSNPNDRRLIVSAWNVGDLPDMRLPPCHVLFQFYTQPLKDTGRLGLSCQVYQRSCDLFLGVPFNIASYALLTCMVANVVGMVPQELIWTGGDTHLYLSHLTQARILLNRDPKPLPTLLIHPADIEEIDDYKMEHFQLLMYNYHPAIKAPVAV